MAHHIGQQFGNYHLLRLLGRGGFAEVYLGEHVYLKTQAALKLLHVQLAPETREDFLNEARTIAHLEHPHIVRVLEFGVHEDTPFLVMQYAPNGTLRTLHPKGTLVAPDSILSYARQIASALQYAHERNLIHRDIKPENMLLGREHEVLLSDFGLALAPPSSQHQDIQSVAGTVTYMAPEQLQGKPSRFSDQYALGVVIYEWFCGTPPFVGSPLEVSLQHMTASPAPLCGRVPALSPIVEQVVLRALAKDPRQRFASVEACAAALEQAIYSDRSDRQTHVLSSPPISHVSPQIGRGRQHPLVGRDKELQILRTFLLETEQTLPSPPADHMTDAFPQTTPSRSSCVLLLGDAGMGKTRLAEEVSREVQQRSWSVVWSRGYAQESSIPYQPWIEALRKAMTQDLWQHEVSQHPRLYQPLTLLLPELVEILPMEAVPAFEASVQGPLGLQEAVLALLRAISQHSPVLLVFDDLHWVDESSRELYAFLARRLDGYRVLLLGTYRKCDVPSSHPLRLLLTNLQREQALVSLPLHPLTEEQISSLVAHLPAPLTRDILTRAAGNPFFAEELARSAEIQLSVAHTPASKEHTVLSVPLPDTIAAVLELRISQLSSACQRLLSGASVLGDSFTFPIICQLEMSGNSSKDEDSILDLVEEALQATILTEEGTGTHICYHFWHPLLVSHLYDQLSAARRARLHRHAAEVLQRIYSGREEEVAATITNHLVEVGDESAHIVHYAVLAADRAYSLSAYPEAERYYRIAATQLEEVLCQQPAGAHEDEQARLASLLERQGECARNQGKFEEARRLYERVLEVRSMWRMLASHADSWREAQIDALLRCKIGRTWYDTGDTAPAQHYCADSEQVLHEAGVVGGPAWASIRLLQGFMCRWNGHYTEALTRAREALLLFEEALQQPEGKALQWTNTKSTPVANPVDLGRSYSLLAGIANAVGNQREALDNLNTALILFEQYNYQSEVANVCCNLGDIYLKKAEHELAQAHLRRSLSLAERLGDVSVMSTVFCNLGVLAARSGNLAEAEAWFKRSITLAEQINDQFYISLFHVYLALLHQDQGQLLEARACVFNALTIGRVIGNTPCIGFALVALGKLRLALSRQAYETSTDVICHSSLPPSQAEMRSPADMPTRFLQRARKTVQRALSLKGIEMETRSEGHLLEAEISLLLGNLGTAEQLTTSMIERAREREWTDLCARARRLLGEVLTAQGKPEQAYEQFEEAIAIFRRCGMPLECARTLQHYGAALLQNHASEQASYQQGLGSLHEARHIFLECQAAHDLQAVEHILAMLVPA